jgi:hypothetical protein
MKPRAIPITTANKVLEGRAAKIAA